MAYLLSLSLSQGAVAASQYKTHSDPGMAIHSRQYWASTDPYTIISVPGIAQEARRQITNFTSSPAMDRAKRAKVSGSTIRWVSTSHSSIDRQYWPRNVADIGR
eukprot:1584201-Rhodomonas_salina.3